MKLYPLKCVFGVPSRKLLGFIISYSGIEVNPEMIKAILDIKMPTCLKDVQRLTGSAAAVSRFISWLGDKALPLYKLLKKILQVRTELRSGQITSTIEGNAYKSTNPSIPKGGRTHAVIFNYNKQDY